MCSPRIGSPSTILRVECRARYRIFGSKPGCYGAGLLALIDERNWRDDADLAETYVNWGGYAYTAKESHYTEGGHWISGRLH